MSWAGGSKIYAAVIDSIEKAATCDSDKQRMAIDLIKALEENDWQGLGDMQMSEEPGFAVAAIYFIHPDWV